MPQSDGVPAAPAPRFNVPMAVTALFALLFFLPMAIFAGLVFFIIPHPREKSTIILPAR